MFASMFIVFALTAGTSGAITSNDVRSDLLFLGQLVRENLDKLERHEFRERQLGDNLMKSLAGMDRRLSSMERAAEDRAKRIEAGVREVRKDVQAQMERMQETFSLKVEEALVIARGGPGAISAPDCAKDDHLDGVIANVSQNLNALVKAIPTTNHESSKAIDSCLSNVREVQALLQTLSQELRGEISSAGDRTLHVIRESVASNEISADKIAKALDGALHNIAPFFSADDNNQTEQILQRLDYVTATVNDLSDNVKQSYDGILKQVQNFGEVDQVLVRTADNVLDAKRTIEYSVHQIRAEVGEMVRQQSRELNGTLNSRFDAISTDIMAQQSGNAANLSTKIETEISQVWRQIGIMYQQLSNSAEMLQRLQHQTEAYVNGSLKTIGGMEGKVGQITGQMGQVDDNLQFLLGRLSLVTQEFNAVKSSVGATLDGLRSGIVDVQNSIKDTGPGPNPLPPNYPSVEADDASAD